MKKDCSNCGHWKNENMGNCKKQIIVTMNQHHCTEWEMSKIDRILFKHRAATIQITNGNKTQIRISHWIGQGVTIKEAVRDIENKIS